MIELPIKFALTKPDRVLKMLVIAFEDEKNGILCTLCV